MKVAVAALASSLALVGMVDDACACSCVVPDAAAYLDRYEGAFIGKLLEKRDPRQTPLWRSDAQAVYVFEVERVAKGALQRILDVTSAVSGASCGLEVPPGRRVGLFLERAGAAWRSSLCLQVSAVDLERAAARAGIALRSPIAVEHRTAGGGDRDTRRRVGAVGASALLVIALAAASVWLRRRRGRAAGA